MVPCKVVAICCGLLLNANENDHGVCAGVRASVFVRLLLLQLLNQAGAGVFA